MRNGLILVGAILLGALLGASLGAQSGKVTFGGKWFAAEQIDVNGHCALVAYSVVGNPPISVSIAPCK